MTGSRDRRLLLRLMIALAFTSLLGWQFKGHCVLDGGWSGSEQYTTGCYSDAVPFWDGRGVAAGEVPYFRARMEYPVLTGATIWAEGRVTRALFGEAAGAAHFLFVVSLVNALLAALVLYLLWRAGLPPSRLWGWALAPPLVLYLAHNWDLVAVVLAVLALLLAWRGRLVEAGAVTGLGVAAKLFPVVLLPLLGLAALVRRHGDPSERVLDAALVAIAAAAAWLLVDAPVAAVAFENWSEFFRFSSERSGTAASVWELLGQFGLLSTSVARRNLWATILFAGGAGAIVLAGWRHHRDRLWVLFTPVLAWFMLTNKVYSPQFDLWLYPLLLITCRRPGLIVLFVLGDIAAYFAEFWLFAGQEHAWPATTQGHIALAAALRAAAMLGVIVSAVREAPPTWIDRPEPT